ncbi:MAG: division/cell wall cluster transcriptional repressor MraZ [Clostridiales bacterium]|nr:division/cell wall cluster transcriptional repressor MraZ [Clostridiales bacterium]
MGEYRHSLDEKGRLIMPARLREGLGDTFVVTKGLDQCLFAYPQEEWKKLQLKLQKLPFTQANARAFVRFFFSGAAECSVDKQGRISLPAHLREYARLEKDVVILGVGSRVELWDPQVWDAYAQETAQQYAAIAEQLVGLDGS